MSAVCFYFQVHQPYRIKKFRVFDIGKNHDYFVDKQNTGLNNEIILKRVSQKCYLPTNRLLLDLLSKNLGFKISFSFSGVVLDQLEKYCPEVIKSFQDLVKTGQVEILSETHYHSLSFIYSKREFRSQVEKHRQKIMAVFGQKPQIFRNTELIYNNELAQEIEDMGYKGILIEGADKVLGQDSPNFIRHAKGTQNLKLLLKNYKLSDDIAFRFSQKNWNEYPLTSKKFARWISSHDQSVDIINLFMDYETFGEHQWEESGIFKFLKSLPQAISENPGNSFVTPSEAIGIFKSVGQLNVDKFISWADVERDLSAWVDNSMQKDAIEKLYGLEQDILATQNDKLIEDWRRLQSSDHFYYMCTKFFADGDVHKYFNPYESPYEAFINYMNALTDLESKVRGFDRANKLA